MDRAKRLPKIGDAERESMFGYVYAVSGPGKDVYLIALNALFSCFELSYRLEQNILL